MTTVAASQLFRSVVRALDLYQGDPGLIPSEGTGIFQLCFTLSCYHVIRKRFHHHLSKSRAHYTINIINVCEYRCKFKITLMLNVFKFMLHFFYFWGVRVGVRAVCFLLSAGCNVAASVLCPLFASLWIGVWLWHSLVILTYVCSSSQIEFIKFKTIANLYMIHNMNELHSCIRFYLVNVQLISFCKRVLHSSPSKWAGFFAWFVSLFFVTLPRGATDLSVVCDLVFPDHIHLLFLYVA